MRRHRATIARVVADVVMVNVALIAALALRFLHVFFSSLEPERLREVLTWYNHAYLVNAIPFSVAAVLVFYLNGVYTRTLGYAGKFKVVVILRATTILYLVGGSFHYFVWQGEIPNTFPRGVLLLGWLFTFAMAAGTRVAKDLVVSHVRSTTAKAPTVSPEAPHRVLVIGGCGYTGSIVCRRLLGEGYRVRVLDNLMFGLKPVEELMDNEHFELERGDFREVESVVRTMRGANSVIHLGAIVGDPACAIDSQFTVDVNYAAARLVAEVAKGYGVERLLFASTCSVYGASNDILDEHSALNPLSLYSQTKLDAEKALLQAAGSDFHPVILRLATVFGFSPRPRFDLVVNLLTAQAYTTGSITIYNGEQWRPFIHVRDVAEATLCILRAPINLVRAQVYNVGANHLNCRISDLGLKIGEIVPQTTVHFETNDNDARNYRVSFDKIHRELGFSVMHDLEYGIREIVGALERGEIDDYRDEKYSNVAYTRRILEAERRRAEQQT